MAYTHRLYVDIHRNCNVIKRFTRSQNHLHRVIDSVVIQPMVVNKYKLVRWLREQT